MVVSARTGEGVEEWRRWLAERVARARRCADGMSQTALGPAAELLARGLAARREAEALLFEAEAGHIAELCHAVAERCARGGRLLACACSPAGASDARHVAVEFVHPVIVGKRALPALALLGERGRLADEVALLARADDVVLVFGEAADAPALRAALAVARERGGADRGLRAARRGLGDRARPRPTPYIRQELVETVYHIVWELSHVFFEHRGLLGGRTRAARPRCRRVELPLPVPERERERSRRRAGRRARLGAG